MTKRKGLQKEHIHWLKHMGCQDESPVRCCALIALCEHFDGDISGGRAGIKKRFIANRAAIKARQKELLRGDYDSVILIFIMVTIAGAALSWAMERLLDWLFPSSDVSPARLHRLEAEQQSWQSDS